MEEYTNEQKIEWLKDNIPYKPMTYILAEFREHQIVELYDCIHEDCYPESFGLSDNPSGEFQTDNYSFKVWVDQKTGYCSDCYYGEIYIEIKEGKYFVASFSA